MTPEQTEAAVAQIVRELQNGALVFDPYHDETYYGLLWLTGQTGYELHKNGRRLYAVSTCGKREHIPLDRRQAERIMSGNVRSQRPIREVMSHA